jgi:hypothetical protein
MMILLSLLPSHFLTSLQLANTFTLSNKYLDQHPHDHPRSGLLTTSTLMLVILTTNHAPNTTPTPKQHHHNTKVKTKTNTNTYRHPHSTHQHATQ